VDVASEPPDRAGLPARPGRGGHARVPVRALWLLVGRALRFARSHCEADYPNQGSDDQQQTRTSPRTVIRSMNSAAL